MSREMTREQYKEIRRLTRAAQRRMERATPGQKRALEYYVKKATGAEKWSSAAKGFTYQQAQAQIAKLERFMAGASTTKRGWARIKAQNVEAANKKFTKRQKGFDLTDEEFAELLIQADAKTRQETYRAVNTVQAVKANMEAAEIEYQNYIKDPEAWKKLHPGEVPPSKPEIWTGSELQITKALENKYEYEEAYNKSLAGRKRLIKAQNEADKI